MAPLTDDPERAWDARAAGSARVVRVLSNQLIDELCQCRAALQQPIAADGIGVDNSSFPKLRREAASLLEEHLEGGLGFVILRGLDSGLFSEVEIENVFWRLCVLLGTPLVQKGEDVRFGRVANLGRSAEARPRYHESGTGGSVHTDSPIMNHVADLVGLLCVRPAAAGGESKFVSIARVHDMLRRHAPGLLAELYQPFTFDRRIPPEAVTKDNPALLRAPIFSYDPGAGGDGLRLRWQPEYVWEAPELPNTPLLSERQRLALHLLEGLLEDRSGALTIRLRMRAGDMQFLNNHRVAHGRTGFADPPASAEDAPPDPRLQREMRRVWLRRS